MIKQRNFVVYLLLSFITCGIYSIVFWYQYVEDMNLVCNGDGEETPNYILVMILSVITCGIYGFYFNYAMANRLQRNAPRYNMSLQENGTTILMWNLFGVLICGVGPFVAYYIMIKNMNLIAERFNGNISQSGQGQYYQ